MKSIESQVKAQFAKIHSQNDWRTFKLIAEYYLKKSATLKKSDIEISETYKLLLRNVQKRLFLGIATELLIKSCYLKNGYVINTPNDKQKHPKTLIKFTDINNAELDPNNTFTLGKLIDPLNKVITIEDWSKVKHGLDILKVFRNKEGHIASLWHKYEPQNYIDIEYSITQIYKVVFKEVLILNISMEANQKGQFSINT